MVGFRCPIHSPKRIPKKYDYNIQLVLRGTYGDIQNFYDDLKRIRVKNHCTFKKCDAGFVKPLE